MNAKMFEVFGYFVRSYFNWSMNHADLEKCIDEFLISENEKKIEALRIEVETLHALTEPDLIREVAYRLGDRGMPADKAFNVIELLYVKTRKRK